MSGSLEDNLNGDMSVQTVTTGVTRRRSVQRFTQV